MTNLFCRHPSRAARVPLIALMLALISGSAQGSEAHMWFDETGEVHYTNTPRVPRSETFRAGETAPGLPSDAEPVDTEDERDEMAAQELAEHKMIENCEQNHGVDCEREVHTELHAEPIQRGGHVIVR
jgi:hypothetical protein